MARKRGKKLNEEIEHIVMKDKQKIMGLHYKLDAIFILKAEGADQRLRV